MSHSERLFVSSLLAIVVVTFGPLLAEGVIRTAKINEAVRLECRDNQIIKIDLVQLAHSEIRDCVYPLSPYDEDYRRVVAECSGRQVCSNILLQEQDQKRCRSRGPFTDSMMVTYTCVDTRSVFDICHNTERTVSFYDGYLSSPGYPSVPPLSDMVCSCVISTVNSDAKVELLLVDAQSSHQVTIKQENLLTEPLCYKADSSRCINMLTKTNRSVAIISYQLSTAVDNSKFLVQYAAANRSSRIRAQCSMVVIEMTTPAQVIDAGKQAISSPEVQRMQDPVLPLELIVGITSALVAVLLFIVIIIVLCKHFGGRRSNPSLSMMPRLLVEEQEKQEMLAQYEDVPKEHMYSSTLNHARPLMRSTSSDYYQNPSEIMHVKKIYHDSSVSEFPDDAIYESVQSLDVLEADNVVTNPVVTRNSRMLKASSMPKHPAPSAPRSLVKTAKASAVRAQAYRDVLPCQTNQFDVGSSEDTNKPTLDPSRIYDVPAVSSPLFNYHHDETAFTPLCDSMQSLPSLNMDFSDILKEADRHFEVSASPTDEYLHPIDRSGQISHTRKVGADCNLIDNELYKP